MTTAPSSSPGKPRRRGPSLPATPNSAEPTFAFTLVIPPSATPIEVRYLVFPPGTDEAQIGGGWSARVVGPLEFPACLLVRALPADDDDSGDDDGLDARLRLLAPGTRGPACCP